MSEELQPQQPQAKLPDVFLTMIVPADFSELARSIAASIDPGGAGMWTTGLSSSGKSPATHYISTGFVPDGWQQMIPIETWEFQEENWVLVSETPGNPQAIYGICLQNGLQVTFPEIQALFSAVDVTKQDPWLALSRLNLRLVQEDATQEGLVSQDNLG